MAEMLYPQTVTLTAVSNPSFSPICNEPSTQVSLSHSENYLGTVKIEVLISIILHL